MLQLSSYMLSHVHTYPILTTPAIKSCHRSYGSGPSSSQHHNKSPSISLFHSSVAPFEKEAQETDVREKSKLKWYDIGPKTPNITESQRKAISQLPPKMTNRCKALMKRIICFSPQDEKLSFLLAAWVRVMKPRRSDWLSILKELKRSENTLHLEVMEYVLEEDSFEANVRDYTKLIDTYAKQEQLQDAENAFQAMKSRGFPCDQVTLTVLVHMYSNAGDVGRAKETFDEIKSLGLPLDRRAYDSMIMAYIRAGMLESAESLVREMEVVEITAGREVYKALLRAYSTAGDAGGAQRAFDAVQFAGIVPDCKLCALLINAYTVDGQSDKARSVLENMKRVGLKPSDKCVALMLSAYERENSLDKALAFLKELEDYGVAVGQEALEVLVRWFHILGVVEQVEDVVREISNKGRRSKLLCS